MNQKLLIVLLSVILHNGVTYSLKEQVSGAKMSDKISSTTTSVTEGIKKNEEPFSVADHLVSGAPIKTSVPQHGEISTTQSTTVISHPTDEGTTANSSIKIVQNVNRDSVSQNTSKNADNKTSSQGLNNKNANLTDGVPTNKNSIESISTNSPLTSAAVASTTATPVQTTIKSTVSTVATTPTLIKKVVMGQNTPAPVEEKHFDGPSFIGGIVLTIGLTAIGFIAFKYYKSGKIDMNYRTL